MKDCNFFHILLIGSGNKRGGGDCNWWQKIFYFCEILLSILLHTYCTLKGLRNFKNVLLFFYSELFINILIFIEILRKFFIEILSKF